MADCPPGSVQTPAAPIPYIGQHTTEFHVWVQEEIKGNRCMSNDEEHGAITLHEGFVSNSNLEVFLQSKLDSLLGEALQNCSTSVVVGDIHPDYLKAFAILLYIGHGDLIRFFVKNRSFRDERLPLRDHVQPTEWPGPATDETWTKFKEAQWLFLPVSLTGGQEQYDPHEIVPFLEKSLLACGESSSLHVVSLHKDFDLLNANALRPDEHKSYVLKTYKGSGAEAYHRMETETLFHLQHRDRTSVKGLIRCYSSYSNGESYSILLEYAEGGSLKQWMEKMPEPVDGLVTAVYWGSFMHCVRGLEHIHELTDAQSIDLKRVFRGLHQDICSDNILLVRDPNPNSNEFPWLMRLSDLGLSHFEMVVHSGQESTAISDMLGIKPYGAPELFPCSDDDQKLDRVVSQKLDIFALGCLILELATWLVQGKRGVQSFREKRCSETRQNSAHPGDRFHDGSLPEPALLSVVLEQITAVRENMRRQDFTTGTMLDLAVEMLQPNPEKRPSVAVIRQTVERRLLTQNHPHSHLLLPRDDSKAPASIAAQQRPLPAVKISSSPNISTQNDSVGPLDPGIKFKSTALLSGLISDMNNTNLTSAAISASSEEPQDFLRQQTSINRRTNTSSPMHDLVYTSRLEVEVLKDCVKQTARRRNKLHPTETWEKVKALGKGGFGEVHLQRCVQDEHRVRAVKQLAKGSDIDYSRELEAAALFSRDMYQGAFVQSFGWYETPRHVFLTMEYLPLGDLRSYMHQRFPESEVQLITSQVLEGLHFMHERHFTHRDLKPENILVQEQGPQWWVKITDFGISKRAQDGDDTLRTNVYTPQFVAPEVLFVKGSYTRAVDIWSTGVIVFLLLTGDKAVFETVPDLLQYWQRSIELPTHRLHAYNVSAYGCSLLSWLLSSNPDHRPDAGACLQHIWLSEPSQEDIDPPDRSSPGKLSAAFSKEDTEYAAWTTIDDDQSKSQPADPHAAHRSDQSLAWTSLPVTVQSQSKDRAASTTGVPDTEQVYSSFDQLSGWNPRLAPEEIQEIEPVNLIPSSNELLSPNRGQVGLTDHRSSRQITSSGSKSEPAVARVQLNWSAKKLLEGHKQQVSCVKFSPDGRVIASASSDTTIRLWDVSTGTEVMQFWGHGHVVWCVDFAPDGQVLASGGGDAMVRVWDLSTGAEIKQFRGHGGAVWSVSFSPDGRLVASGSHDGDVRLWNSSTGLEVERFRDVEKDFCPIYCVAFSPGGGLIVSGSNDGLVELWDITLKRVIRRFKGHKSSVTGVAFSPDGRLLASRAYDKTLRIWETRVGTEVRRFRSDGAAQSTVAFSSDGRLVITGENDSTLRIWDIKSRTEIKRFTSRGKSLTCAALSPDGRLAVSGGYDQVVTLWDLMTSHRITDGKSNNGPTTVLRNLFRTR